MWRKPCKDDGERAEILVSDTDLKVVELLCNLFSSFSYEELL